MEGTENTHMDDSSQGSRDEIYSKVVRAGKRTYFFDVKATRGNDLYLTITESKKRFNRDGRHYYEKHKLFLYKEDFDKFGEGLKETIDKIIELRESGDFERVETDHNYGAESSNDTSTESNTTDTTEESVAAAETTEMASNQFTDVSFDDLGGDENPDE